MRSSTKSIGWMVNENNKNKLAMTRNWYNHNQNPVLEKREITKIQVDMVVTKRRRRKQKKKKKENFYFVSIAKRPLSMTNTINIMANNIYRYM